MMQLEPVDLVRGEVELPSLSAVFQQFTAKLDEPKATANDFSEIISTDPSLIVRVLKIVNSAFYSFTATITDIPHAITIIGLSELRELILALSVVEFFDGLPNDLISMESFWNHSVLTGLLARELQKSPKVQTKESVYTAGMLHDVGSLVFYNRLPEVAKSVIELEKRQAKSRYLLEQEIIGFDHAAIGGELMRHWGLPDFLIEVVSNHHQPDKAKSFQEEAQLINFADQVARIIESGANPGMALKNMGQSIVFEIPESKLEESIDAAKEKQAAMVAAIMG